MKRKIILGIISIILIVIVIVLINVFIVNNFGKTEKPVSQFASTQVNNERNTINQTNTVIQESNSVQNNNQIMTQNSSKVYFTSDISSEGLIKAYNTLGWKPTGNVAVKLSTGESAKTNYLRPELIKDLVQSVNGTIVECNTAYGGSRLSTASHYQIGKDRGYTEIANFKILDENGSMSLPVSGGKHLQVDFVGKAFADYNSYLVLSHFKGHAMAGFGGAMFDETKDMLSATVADEGILKNINLGLWLDTSTEGGGFIYYL